MDNWHGCEVLIKFYKILKHQRQTHYKSDKFVQVFKKSFSNGIKKSFEINEIESVGERLPTIIHFEGDIFTKEWDEIQESISIPKQDNNYNYFCLIELCLKQVIPGAYLMLTGKNLEKEYLYIDSYASKLIQQQQQQINENSDKEDDKTCSIYPRLFFVSKMTKSIYLHVPKSSL